MGGPTFLGPIVGAGAAVIFGLLNVLVGRQTWPGDPLLTVEWMAMALFLVAPVLAAVSAMEGGAVRRHSVLAASPYRRAHLTRVLVHTASAVSLVFVSFIGWGLSRLEVFPHGHGVSMLVRVGCLIAAIWLYVLVGMVMGVRFGPAIGAVLAMVGAFVLALLGMQSGLGPFSVGASGSLVGVSTPWTWSLAQLATAGLLAGILIAALLSRRPPPLVLEASLVLAVIAGVLAPATPHRYQWASGEWQTWACAQSDRVPGVRACVASEHSRLLVELEDATTRLHVALRRVGVTWLPMQTRQVVGPLKADRGVIWWTPSAEILDTSASRRPITVSDVIGAAASAPWCPGLRGTEPPTDEFWEASETLQASLTAIVDGTEGPTTLEDLRRGWDALDACVGAR